MLSSVDLPLPEGPSSTTSSPRCEREVDPAQRVHLDLAHVVDLGEALRAQDQIRREGGVDSGPLMFQRGLPPGHGEASGKASAFDTPGPPG